MVFLESEVVVGCLRLRGLMEKREDERPSGLWALVVVDGARPRRGGTVGAMVGGGGQIGVALAEASAVSIPRLDDGPLTLVDGAVSSSRIPPVPPHFPPHVLWHARFLPGIHNKIRELSSFPNYTCES